MDRNELTKLLKEIPMDQDFEVICAWPGAVSKRYAFKGRMRPDLETEEVYFFEKVGDTIIRFTKIDVQCINGGNVKSEGIYSQIKALKI
jgi:hypothetical protein